MDTTSSSTTAYAPTQNKKGVKLVFRLGDKKDFISKYEGKIAIIDRALKTAPVVGISYTCELKSMMKGNGWIVVAFEKTPAIKTNLVFKRGKKMYNERTNDYKENMTSTMKDDGKIVIAPEEMKLELEREYACEVVLSPNGRAYIVETAVLAVPVKAEIIAHEYPSSCVEVKIDGVTDDSLRFDCTDDDEKSLESKVWKLSCRSIIDMDMVVSNYEATCMELLGKHKSMGYKRNAG